ncbi:MAG: hypothetical protein AAF799_33935 [Myxococcota bacterium]
MRHSTAMMQRTPWRRSGALALLVSVDVACFESFEPSPSIGSTGSMPSGPSDPPTPMTTEDSGPPPAADSTTSAVSTGSESSTGSSTGGPGHMPCPAATLPAAPLPSSIEANTLVQRDELGSACGGGSAPEVAFTFTPPRDGEYIFDTEGSEIDTVLYVLDGTCEGRELACDDDGIAGANTSLLSLPLPGGQPVTVVVDAFGIEGGPVTLTVREGSVQCPATTLGPALPDTATGQTLLATDRFELPCGTMDEADQAHVFTAPSDGIYRFDTAGSDFDTTLGILDGECDGTVLACNGDRPGAFDGHSGLALPLRSGQAVTAVVEGYLDDEGEYTLTVDRLDGACPDEDLGALAVPFMVMGTTAMTDEATAGSCGGLGSPDYAYQWQVPQDGIYRFDTSGSGFDTVVYLLDETCMGEELRCNDDAGGPAAAVSALLSAGQVVMVVVDGANASGTYTLTVEETEDAGDCCDLGPDPGCEDVAIEVCVCTLDAFCCTDEWDAGCVTRAIDDCGAICL